MRFYEYGRLSVHVGISYNGTLAPTPDQNVYHAKRGIFQWEVRIREIKKNG